MSEVVVYMLEEVNVRHKERADDALGKMPGDLLLEYLPVIKSRERIDMSRTAKLLNTAVMRRAVESADGIALDKACFKDISRLGRSTKDLLNIIDTLTEKGVTLISHKEKIDTDTPAERKTNR